LEINFVIGYVDFLLYGDGLRKALLLLLFGLIVCTTYSYAGWSENIRLTYRGNEINPQIIARNDTIHIAWNQSGTGHVSYIRSTDGGATWDSLVNLNAPGHWGNNAKLNLAENGLFVSWFDFDNNVNISSIAYATSADGGTWSAPANVYTDNPSRFGNPVSTVKGDSIFLAYHSNRDDTSGLSPFRAMHSYNYGQTWSDEVTVGHPYVLMAQDIRLEYCSGALLLAWAGTADPSRIDEVHVYGYRSTDAGGTWSDTIWISPNTPNWAQDVCLTCNYQTSQFAIGYMDYRYQIYSFWGDIFIATSNNLGLNWPFETLSSQQHTAAWPSIYFFQDTIIAAWADIQFNVMGYPEIVFNRSNDGGQSWLGEYRITYTERESGAANVFMNNSKVYLVWGEDLPNEGLDLFYKIFTPDSTDAVDNNEIPAPVNFSLSAYPNPFNSATTITLTGAEQAEIGIYDISGRLITTLHATGGQALWDASAYSSGLYFARVAGEKASTIKLILVK
jgi:hypothetical protein